MSDSDTESSGQSYSEEDSDVSSRSGSDSGSEQEESDEEDEEEESDAEDEASNVTETKAQLPIDSEKDLLIDLKVDKETGKILESNLKIVKKEGKADVGTNTGVQTDNNKLSFPDLRYGTHMSIEQLTELAIEVLLAPDERLPEPKQNINSFYAPPRLPTVMYDTEPSMYVRDRYSLNPIPSLDSYNVLRRQNN